MKRHSELSLCSSDLLSSCRSNAVTKDSLDCYYSSLKETLEGNNLMNKSTCIYNMDEMGMPLDSKQLKRIVPRGLKKVYGPSTGKKTQITVLSCANAVGTMLSPMVIFKGNTTIMNCRRERCQVLCMECPQMAGLIRICLLGGSKS